SLVRNIIKNVAIRSIVVLLYVLTIQKTLCLFKLTLFTHVLFVAFLIFRSAIALVRFEYAAYNG
ncbi:hypothetical protein, partial [Caballeronia sp. BR00000012568055]|uniref:hypothetical protein n=1 Tax=Caballeronia sp. BR00000012568055 TaxID=2918761 RepID=UPI0023F734D0